MHGEDNIFNIFINDEMIGVTDSADTANRLYLEARKAVNSKSETLTFSDVTMTLEGSEVMFGEIDSEKVIASKMEKVIENAINHNLTKGYEVKINDYTVTLKSADEVKELLQAAISKYDESNNFQAGLVLDNTRELPVLKAVVNSNEEVKAEEEAKETANMYSGFDADMISFFNDIKPEVNTNIENYETGITAFSFKDNVEVAEVYINPNQLSDLDSAIAEVTDAEIKNDIYTVVAGDTLSGIAIKVDIPMEDIIAMNSSLEDEHSLIRPDDELIVTVQRPKLTVLKTEVMYYEENYNEDVIIHWNPDKYTTDVTTLIQPSDGHRKVVAEVTFENDKKSATNILLSDVTLPAVAKEIEKGEKVPPTYIKPISGGRMTSTFGPRKRPKAGASSYHKGIDWGVPKGTPVYASCGGTVVKAGWGSGYGYCVYINHPDGKQTRYAHLSKVLVSAGQKVSQGQRIALSGNTGVSTGPHLHFEILVNGVQVNPFNYLR